MGYVWASTKTKAGVSVAHHANVSRLTPGDTIIHYAEGTIRAVGVVVNRPALHDRPSELPASAWEREGYLARVHYHDLVTPIPLSEVPSRSPDAGPFNRAGAVNQGYLYELSAQFATTLHETFLDKWPIPWVPNGPEPTVWLIQANPDYWDIEVEVPKIGVGGEDTWTVSRHGSEMRSGDRVIIWKSGARAGVYALAEITGPLTTRATAEWRRKMARDENPETVVPIRYTHYLREPLLRSDLLNHSLLGQMTIIRAPQGTNFKLTKDEWAALQELLRMDRWDEFIYWAGRYRAWSGFDDAERDYKLHLGSAVSEARSLWQSGSADWVERLRKALTSKDNNFTNWRVHNPFIAWVQSAPADATAALKPLWDRPEPVADAIDVFTSSLTLPEKAGKSGVITLASVLLAGVDAKRFPPYRRTAYYEAYDLVEYPRPDRHLPHGAIYDYALTFLDRILSEARARGVDLRDRLDAQSVLWSISQVYEVKDWPAADIERLRAFVNGTPTVEDVQKEDEEGDDELEGDPLEALAEELHLDVEYLRKIQLLLEHKRQVIFCGPPGTGKTFVAKKLAELFAGNGGRVEKVQFHPSYAYEDFVEGYRPRLNNGQAGFELVPGPLRRIASEATKNPDATFVLLIDEVNRGNVAKVFGELYYLLEYRDEKISLQYSAEPAELPQNLWIIGTMNTADRSIALVDAALRRRFHFVDFYPDRPPVKGLLRRWLEAQKPELLWVADAVNRANIELGSNHMAIGPSHFLRTDLTEAWVERIWEHSILPYIAEQYFGDDSQLERFALEKLRTPVVQAAAGE